MKTYEAFWETKKLTDGIATVEFLSIHREESSSKLNITVWELFLYFVVFFSPDDLGDTDPVWL